MADHKRFTLDTHIQVYFCDPRAHARRKFYDLHEARPSAPTTEALRRIGELYDLWPALARYCDDGMIEIDNSAAERALRGVAIGRRNYLFAGADTGGERAAAIYT